VLGSDFDRIDLKFGPAVVVSQHRLARQAGLEAVFAALLDVVRNNI
jgi:hypothetical protein